MAARVTAVLVPVVLAVLVAAGRAGARAARAGPAPMAGERPPALGRVLGRAARGARTKWCTAPAGEGFTRCSAADTSYAGEPASYAFTVQNPTANDLGFRAVVTCAGVPTTTCAPETTLLYVASDGGTVPVVLDWTPAADSVGALTVTVVLKPVSGTTDTLTAMLHVTVTIRPTYTVAVRPHASAVGVTQPKDTSVVFTVSNIGSASATYTLVRHCTGTVSCTGTIPGSVTVGSGSDAPVPVPINSGSAGSQGAVSLVASTTGTLDSGVVTIRPLSRAVAVSPAEAAVPIPAGVDTAATFTVTDVGETAPVTYHLTRTCATPVTNCTGPDSVVVASLNAPVNARVAYHTASGTTGGTGGVTLVASVVTGPTTDRSTGFVRVTVPNTTDSLYATLATSPTAIERAPHTGRSARDRDPERRARAPPERAAAPRPCARGEPVRAGAHFYRCADPRAARSREVPDADRHRGLPTPAPARTENGGARRPRAHLHRGHRVRRRRGESARRPGARARLDPGPSASRGARCATSRGGPTSRCART